MTDPFAIRGIGILGPGLDGWTNARVVLAGEALASLSEKKREVVVLVTIEGMSGEEVAALLGIPVATVWTRLHHARREMSARMLEEEP